MENQGDALRGRHVQFRFYRQQVEDLQEKSNEGKPQEYLAFQSTPTTHDKPNNLNSLNDLNNLNNLINPINPSTNQPQYPQQPQQPQQQRQQLASFSTTGSFS